MNDIITQAGRLADARRAQQRLKDAENEAQNKVHELPEWATYATARGSRLESDKQAKLAYEILAGMLEDAHRESGANGFGDGLSVVNTNTLEIKDQDEFYEWAIKEARFLIPIDEKAAMKLALVQDVPGLDVVKEPKARIAADLSTYETPQEEL